MIKDKKMIADLSARGENKPVVMRRFLFQYRFDGGADFNVTLTDVNMNRAMEQFAKKYHSVDKVYSIDEIPSNGA